MKQQNHYNQALAYLRYRPCGQLSLLSRWRRRPHVPRCRRAHAVYVVDGADLERHYRQSQAAERMGRDFIAYRLGQVKSHINNFYFKNNQRT